MNKTPSPAVAASVRQRLLNGARQRGEEFQRTLTRYGGERLLYRLSQSPHRDRFILKGAALFLMWSQEQENIVYRPTRDLDLWAAGKPAPQAMVEVFREIVAMPVEPDGLSFPVAEIHAVRIRDDELYEGARLHLLALLGAARIPLQVDIGFGDAITPSVLEGEYPVLLSQPAPHLRLYPRETVVSEKFEAMVSLGLTNTRMKDFFDLWMLSEIFAFDGTVLSQAMAATFARRNTTLPLLAPAALTSRFADDLAKIKGWQNFLLRNELEAPDLAGVVARLQDFLMPPAQAAARRSTLKSQWQAGAAWMTGEGNANF